MRSIAPAALVLAVIDAIAATIPITSHAKTPTPSAVATVATSTPLGLPAAPSEAALLGGAELFWKDNSNNENAFRIAIRVRDHVATYNAGANVTSFLLPADAPHVCEPNGGPALFGSVVAVSAGGESAPANFGLFAVCDVAKAPTSTTLVSATPTPKRSATSIAVAGCAFEVAIPRRPGALARQCERRDGISHHHLRRKQ